jgi:hypothetical protein
MYRNAFLLFRSSWLAILLDALAVGRSSFATVHD